MRRTSLGFVGQLASQVRVRRLHPATGMTVNMVDTRISMVEARKYRFRYQCVRVPLLKLALKRRLDDDPDRLTRELLPHPVPLPNWMS